MASNAVATGGQGGTPSLTFFLFVLILKPASGEKDTLVSVVESYMDEIIGGEVLENALRQSSNVPKNLDSESIVLQLTQKISGKLLKIGNAVEKLHAALVKNMTDTGESMLKYKCCTKGPVKKTWDESCWQSATEGQTPNLPQEKMLAAAKENQVLDGLIKLQRYVDNSGVVVHHPLAQAQKFCTTSDKTNFTSTILSLPKDYVIAVDSNIFASDLNSALMALEAALSTISPSDRFVVFAFSGEVSIPTMPGGPIKCPGKKMIYGSQRNKDAIFAWLKTQRWESEELADYKKTFETAFDYFDAMEVSANSKERTKIFSLVTKSASKNNQKEAFEVIVDRNARKEHQAAILVYDLTSPVAQTALLTAFAQQNGETYGVSKVEPALEGKYVRVDDMDHDLKYKLDSYYEYVDPPRPSKIQWSWPHHYPATDIGMIMTASKAVIVNDEFKGVVSTDVSLKHLVEDEANGFTKDEDVYSFVLSGGLKIISHPYLSWPTSKFYPELPVLDLRNFETSDDLNDLRFNTARNDSTMTASVKATWKNYAAATGTGFELHDSTISCRRTEYSVFIVCVVVKNEPASKISNQVLPEDFKFQYHRLDLSPHDKECHHVGKASFKGSSVFLCPDAFVDSDNYVNEKESENTVKEYSNDVKDKRGLVITSTAVQDIFLTFTLENHWQGVDEKMLDTDIGKMTLWKYVGTKNGVLRVWPGVQLPKYYDFRRAPWYVDAISNQDDKFVMTTPYVDAGTGKWIISFSRAIKLTTSSGKTEVYAVIGFDVLIHEVEKFFSFIDDKCHEFCILARSSGFVIYHPDMITNNADFKSHLTEFEPKLSQYLVENNVFEKRSCYQQESSKFYDYFHFDLGRLPYSATNLIELAKAEKTNVIFVYTKDYEKWKKWGQSCRVELRSWCRDGVSCQSPCTKTLNSSCDFMPKESIDVIEPCRTFFELWKVKETDEELEDCYGHFSKDAGFFDWKTFGWIFEIAGGVIIGVSCFIGKSYHLKHRSRAQANNVTTGDGVPPVPPPANQWGLGGQPQGFGISQTGSMFQPEQPSPPSYDNSGQYKFGVN